MRKTTLIISVLLIAALGTLLLTACVPSSLEKAEEKLEKAGYTVMAYEGDAEDLEEGVVGGLVAYKGLLESEGFLTALLFDSAASAKEAYDEYLAEVEEEDTEVKLSGKWIYFGDELGIKDFE